MIIIILDSYIAHVSTLQGPQGAPTLPGYARLPMMMMMMMMMMMILMIAPKIMIIIIIIIIMK